MYSSKPCFPVLPSLKETAESGIFLLFKKNNWLEPKILEAKLSFKPFAFFSFDVLDSEKKVLCSGSNSIDLADFILQGQIFQYFAKFEKSLSNKLPDGFQFEFKKLDIADDVLLQKIVQKLSEKENALTDSIKVWKIFTAYFPIYCVKVSSMGQNFSIEASGIDGKILNWEIVQFLDKSFGEILKETINGLSNPKNFFGEARFDTSKNFNFLMHVKSKRFHVETFSKKFFGFDSEKEQRIWLDVLESLFSSLLFKVLILIIVVLIVVSLMK